MSEIEKPTGLLLVDKPRDWTSFDAVNKVRHVLASELEIKPKQMKVGHSGTLDPAATGLLILAVGEATKQIGSLVKQPKTYEVGAMLGATSSTGDSEGDISINESITPSEERDVLNVVNGFVGKKMQKPHKFSAIKVDGVRAYKLARKGKNVDLEPREIEIHWIRNINYQWSQLRFDSNVSSGTYIRTLVEDIGEKLGTGAYMNSLRRTEIGNYKLSDAISLEDLDYKKVIQALLPLD